MKRSLHIQTSSNFSMIMENALKMEVVGPANVMILSGQFPSEMLMRAPLCRHRWATWQILKQNHKVCSYCFSASYLFSHFLHRLSFLSCRQITFTKQNWSVRYTSHPSKVKNNNNKKIDHIPCQLYFQPPTRKMQKVNYKCTERQ